MVIPLNAEESLQANIDTGFFTKEEAIKFIADLNQFANDTHVIGYLRNTQIAGRKR